MQLSQLNLAARARLGATLILRNETLPIVTATADADHGKYPVYRGADGTPVTVTLEGVDSPTAQQFGYAQRAEAINRYASDRASDPTGVVAIIMTADTLAADDARTVALLVALTRAWSGIEGDDNAPLALTPDAAHQLYTGNPSIRAQALRFVDDRADFFAHWLGNSETSASTSLN